METFSGQYNDTLLFNLDQMAWFSEWNAKENVYWASWVELASIEIEKNGDIVYKVQVQGGDIGLVTVHAEDLWPTRKEALKWARTKLLYELDSTLASAQTMVNAVKEKIANVKQKGAKHL